MRGRLSRGDFVRLAYRLGRNGSTGVLEILETGGPRHRLTLRRGYMTGAQVEGHWAPLGQILREQGAIDDSALERSLGALAGGPILHGRALVAQGAASPAAIERALVRQMELRLERLAAIPEAAYALAPNAVLSFARGGGHPVALAAWARRHLEAQLDARRARLFAGELWGARLALRKNLLPDPTTLDDTDRRIVEALAAPRRLDEIEATARTPQFRLLAFLYFLRQVGALDLMGVAAHPVDETAANRATAGGAATAAEQATAARACRLLGVAPDADDDTLRRAYRRLARALHPDLHPDLPAPARRTLEVRFAEVAEAYRVLSRGRGEPADGPALA